MDTSAASVVALSLSTLPMWSSKSRLARAIFRGFETNTQISPRPMRAPTTLKKSAEPDTWNAPAWGAMARAPASIPASQFLPLNSARMASMVSFPTDSPGSRSSPR